MSQKKMTKKFRNEVFKRDDFQCIYCGKIPPETVLEVELIGVPEDEGKNELDDYVTSCMNCEGKVEKESLSSLKEDIKFIKEREYQIREYKKHYKKIQKRIETECDEVEHAFQKYFENHTFTDQFKESTLKRFLEQLPVHKLNEAMHIAGSRIKEPEKMIKYFCGICWNKIKGTKAPWEEKED